MVDGTGTRTFSYNSQAQPDTESLDNGWLDLDLVRKYETGSSGSGAPVGTYRGYELKAGSTVEHENFYTFDGYLRLSTVSDAYNKTGSFGALAYTYVTSSDLVDFYTNSKVKADYEHHVNRDVVTSVTNQELVGTSSTLSTFSYTLNTLGQRTALTFSGSLLTTAGTWTYTYNDRGELTEADHSVGTTNDLEYFYDAIGNRDWTKKNGVTVSLVPELSYDTGNDEKK